MESLKKSDPTMARMLAAGVPRGCWAVSLSKTGRQDYLDFAVASLEKDVRREVTTCRYLRCPSESQALEEAELAAKACVQSLKGLPVMYTTFHELFRLLRQQPAEEPVLHEQVHRRGAVILANIPTAKWLEHRDYSHSLSAELFAWLQTHVYHGGILVVAGTARLSSAYRSDYPADFERVFVESGEIVEVPEHVGRT